MNTIESSTEQTKAVMTGVMAFNLNYPYNSVEVGHLSPYLKIKL